MDNIDMKTLEDGFKALMQIPDSMKDNYIMEGAIIGRIAWLTLQGVNNKLEAQIDFFEKNGETRYPYKEMESIIRINESLIKYLRHSSDCVSTIITSDFLKLWTDPEFLKNRDRATEEVVKFNTFAKAFNRPMELFKDYIPKPAPAVNPEPTTDTTVSDGSVPSSSTE